jgi:hypothetical protein
LPLIKQLTFFIKRRLPTDLLTNIISNTGTEIIIFVETTTKQTDENKT